MTNPQKNKGDKYERAALAHLRATCPDLVSEFADRIKAGSRKDLGDLYAFDDVVIQVKAMKDAVRGCKAAADGATQQQTNTGKALAVGLVPVYRARQTQVNWLFVANRWPVSIAADAHLVTGQTGTAIEHVRNDKLGIPRPARTALVRRANDPDLWVGTTEAWVAAYRDWLAARARPAAA